MIPCRGAKKKTHRLYAGGGFIRVPDKSGWRHTFLRTGGGDMSGRQHQTMLFAETLQDCAE